MLLDLLGAPEPRFYNYFPDTEGWYYQLVDIESRLGAAGFLVEHAHNSAQHHKKHHQGYFQPYSIQMGVEDDHLPFLRRNVSIVITKSSLLKLIKIGFYFNYCKLFLNLRSYSHFRCNENLKFTL